MKKIITTILIFSCGLVFSLPKTQTAILASAILPGTGEFILGDKIKGEVFLWLDGAIWLTYAGLSWYGNSKERDARLYAVKWSGADLNQKNAEYYHALERYDNSFEYNIDVMRDARYLYPDSIEAQKRYLAENGYFGDEVWDWASDSIRFQYWEQRKSARTTLHQAGLILGATLINRLISCLDCALFTPDRSLSKKMGIVPNLEKPGLAIVYKF